jgi:predicted nucleic acid-binding protein
MRIYLDTCCYGRRFDGQAASGVREETEAIKAVIKRHITGSFLIIGSAAVSSEIGRVPDAAKRERIEAYYRKFVTEDIPTAPARARAAFFMAEGLGEMDSVHLATAESAGADVLLTTDYDFIKICAKKNLSKVKVINPINFKRRFL